MPNLKPKDIIAVLTLVCIVFLLFNGISSPLDQLVPLVVGYYFGHRTQGVDNGT